MVFWRRRQFLLVAPVLTLLTVAACGEPPIDARTRGGPASRPPDGPTVTSSSPGDPAVRAAAIVAGLHDRDLVGQVLMPYAFGRSATDVPRAAATANRELSGVATPAEMISRYRVGGMILVGFDADDPTGSNQPTSNVDSPEQVKALTDGLSKAADGLPVAAPLLIGTDQEYGVVTRLRRGVTALPSAMAFGAAGDPALTESAWRAAGAELSALGVNVDFAPVADVLGGPGGPIGSRSYGSDPAAVSRQVAGAVRGLQATGVAATLKHFPGHGHTAVDSHTDLPVLGQRQSVLNREDLPPFAAGIDAGAWLVMSGHLDVEAVDPGVPATFSHKILTDLLRGKMKFTGVVVSDALNMEPAKRWPPGEAAVRALVAGNDLLLMPPNLSAAYDGLLSALGDGKLPRERLVEAATRVVTLRLKLAAQSRPDESVIGSPAHISAVTAVSRASVTVLRGPCDGPLVAGPVTVTASGGREQAQAWLREALTAAGVEVVPSGGSEIHLTGYGDGPADLRAESAVTVAMDMPYLLGQARSPVLLATYSSSRLSMTALADAIAGRYPPRGRSPVPVAGLPRTACER